MKVPFFVLFLLLFFSCSEKNDSKNEDVQDTVEVKDPVIYEEAKLSTFSGFPEGVDGCNCYFGADSSSVVTEDFVFVSTYDSIGYISLNNKVVKLSAFKSNRSISEFGDTDHEAIYQNDSIRVEISWEYQNKTGYESWWNKGEMDVFVNEKLLESTSFVGECGC